MFLHNFVRERDGYRYDDTSIIQGWKNVEITNVARGSRIA